MAEATPAPMPTEPISVEEALAQARLDVADELAAEDAEEAVAATEVKKANAERGPDGKFKPAEAKAEAAKDTKEPKAKAEEPARAKPKEGEESKGGAGLARRLYSEGRLPEAFKVAFGVDIEESETLPTKAWKEVGKLHKGIKAEAREAEQRGAQQLQQAQQLVQAYIPLAQAKVAYEQGDYETFVRLATGDDFTTFQRKLIAQVAQTKDPAAEARIAQLEARERAREAAFTRMQQAAADQRQEQAVQQHVAGIASELKECGDPRLEAAATKKAFLDKVLDIQREHWDKHTRTTLPPTEAGELAWEELYGDLLEVRTERGGARGLPERGGVPREGVRVKASTNLRHSQAAEAAPEDDLEGDELLQHFIRKAQSQQRAAG